MQFTAGALRRITLSKSEYYSLLTHLPHRYSAPIYKVRKEFRKVVEKIVHGVVVERVETLVNHRKEVPLKRMLMSGSFVKALRLYSPLGIIEVTFLNVEPRGSDKFVVEYFVSLYS